MGWKILITDGLEATGIRSLMEHGFQVDNVKLAQEEISVRLPDYDGIIVRSATKVRSALIDHCPNLKFIARAGVGLDNIDAEYAASKGIAIINTPASSSRSVAELALCHMMCLTRGLHRSNRGWEDEAGFQLLKKNLSVSTELKGKTLLLIGLGRIGRELAKMALGIEMQVIAFDPFVDKLSIDLQIQDQSLTIDIPLLDLETALPKADYVSLHAPYSGKAILHRDNLHLLKNTAYIINTSRGENLDEESILNALQEGKLAGVGLDVFHHEPKVRTEWLNHPKASISPHIGASTLEAQLRIADEMVEKIVALRQSKQ